MMKLQRLLMTQAQNKKMRAGMCSSAVVAETAEKKKTGSLYRRISPVGDPTVSIGPVLDEWLEEGRNVKKEQLHHIIKELRRYGRFKHALQVSQWMTDKMKYALSTGDVAVRLDLISRIHGAEQAEKYFENIEEESRHNEAYANILNCYAREKSVEKAEAIMKKIKELGMKPNMSCYNALLNLYRRVNNQDKMDSILREMEENEVKYDKFTFSILMSMYVDASDVEGMEKILRKMESEPKVALDWDAYSIAANGFIKAGLHEKAFEMLKKSEGFITSKKQSAAFDFLLTQYAAIGKIDEVFRIWNLHKQKSKLYNKSYIVMITSLLKLDDLESAEKIFDDWESQNLAYDFRIPNFLVGAYSRKGLMEKAEAFIERAKMKGGKPIPPTFYYLATGYIGTKEMEKALVAMKMAISTYKIGWKPSTANLSACLEYLKEKGDDEEAKEFMKLLLDKGIVSSNMYDELLDQMKKGGEIKMENC